MNGEFTMKVRIVLLAALLLLIAQSIVSAQSNTVCAVYVTGIGCANCAVTDPVLLSELPLENENVVVIEYEIYKQNVFNYPASGGYFYNYVPYGVHQGVPFLILDKNNYYIGRYNVLDGGDMVKSMGSNDCPLGNGSSVSFENLDIASLPGRPKIWSSNRVLISSGGGGDNEILRELMTNEDISSVLSRVDHELIAADQVQISGSKITFDNAVKLGGWVLQWNEGDGNSTNSPGLEAYFTIIVICATAFIYRRVSSKR